MFKHHFQASEAAQEGHSPNRGAHPTLMRTSVLSFTTLLLVPGFQVDRKVGDPIWPNSRNTPIQLVLAHCLSKDRWSCRGK
jgi:hypothetical protein